MASLYIVELPDNAAPSLTDLLALQTTTETELVRGADIHSILKLLLIDEDNMASDSLDYAPTQQSVKAFVESFVSSPLNYQGGYDASTNTPDLDTTPSGISIGDMYTVTAAGDFFTEGVEAGDVLIAQQDNPTLLTHWSIVNKNIDLTFLAASDTPASYTGHGSKVIAVNVGETAVEFVDLSTVYEPKDTNIVKSNATKTFTAGYSATPFDEATKTAGTFTPNEVNGNFQYAINGGAHTLAPPVNNCTILIHYTNNASAGAITTTGFTKVDGAFTTTNADEFFAFITKCNGKSHLNIVALQ